MASTSVGSASDSLQVDSIPVVDLRFLSQTDLHALSLCSRGGAAFDPRRCDDVVIPQIDRSVFNESAGSRKQTYSRLRLAPRKPESSPASTTTSAVIPRRTNTDDNDPDRAENSRIIDLLKGLFGAEANGDDLAPIRVEYCDFVPQLPNAGGEGKKRKRGRPRKDEIRAVMEDVSDKAVVLYENVEDKGKEIVNENVSKDIVVYKNVEDRDKEILNKNGNVVDLGVLGSLEDPYDVELRRRTENMRTEEELLVFLGGLNGKWGTWRRKKKVVDAGEFGDALPKGWKLLLSIRKKQGRVWLYVSRYISPNGRQFVSCKEVSSYLLSLFGLADANQTNCGQSNENSQLNCKTACENAADIAVKEINKSGDPVSYSPSAITCVTDDHDKQVNLEVGNSGENQMAVVLKCNKCNVTFTEKDDLLYHQLSSHRRKRSRLGTSVTDGVIIKDGQYECQFCHKTFTERHRYNGHVGAHVRHHMKSDEASSEVLSMQNSAGPVSSCGVPPTESVMQTSIGDDYDASTFNAKTDSVLEPASPQAKCKADSDIESNTDRSGHEDNVLSHDEQDSKSNCNRKFCEEFCVNDNRDNRMNSSLGRLDDANVLAAKCDSLFDSEVAKSDAESNSIGELAANKSNDCPVGQERNLETQPHCTSATEKTCDAEINVKGDSTNIEESNQQAGSESFSLAPHGNGKTCGTNIMDCVYPMESSKPDTEKFDNEPNHGFCTSQAGPDEDVVTEDKQQNSCGGCSSFPISNEQKCDNSNDVTVILTSALAESKQKSCSKSCNEETCGVKDSYRDSTSSVSDPKIDAPYNSGNKEVMIGCGGGPAGIEEDVVTVVEQENSDSHLLVPSWEDKLHDIKDNVNVVSVCTIEERCSETRLHPSDYEQAYGVKNDVGSIVTQKMEPKLDKLQTYRNNELAFGISQRRPNTQERSLQLGSLFSSGNEQTFFEENVTGDCNSTDELPKQKGSFNGFLMESCTGNTFADLYSANTISKCDEVRNSSNSELILAFGNHETGIVADGMDSVPIEQTLGFETNLNMENSRIGKDTKEESSLFGASRYSRTCADENNLNRFNTDRVWEGPIIDEVVNSGNDNLTIGFGSYNARSVGDVMPGNMWRTDENLLQSTLADTSTQLEQSSSFLPSFTLFPDKGENELLGVKYDSMLGFDGAQSGHEQVEFSFLTQQNLSSLPGSSKALSYNTEVGPGFDSSFWLERDALSLNIASRNQVTSVCIWCRNEFHQESAHAGTHTGAIGTVCPTCRAKVSQQFNFF